MGPYTEDNSSLHIYGQDYTEKGMDTFFEQFPTEESFINRAWASEKARDSLVIPELWELKGEETWKFTPESLVIIGGLIERFEKGELP